MQNSFRLLGSAVVLRNPEIPHVISAYCLCSLILFATNQTLEALRKAFFKYSSVISDGFPVMVGKNIMSFNAKIYNLLKK